MWCQSIFQTPSVDFLQSLFNRAIAISADYPMQKIAVEIVSKRKMVLSQKIKAYLKVTAPRVTPCVTESKRRKNIWKREIPLVKYFCLSTLSLELSLEILMLPN